MNKTDTIGVTQQAGEAAPGTETDWLALAAMSEQDAMAAALADPQAQPMTPEELAVMRRVSRVKLLRERLDLTQAEFSRLYRLSVSLLRDWEQHRSIPDAPAQALLLAIERDPETMRRLLAEHAA